MTTFFRSINRRTISKAVLHIRHHGFAAFYDNMKYRVRLKMQAWHGAVMKNTMFPDSMAQPWSMEQPLTGSLRFPISGFCRMSFRLVDASPHDAGPVRFTLMDDAGNLLYRATSRSLRMRTGAHLLFQFPRLRESAGRTYRFRLEGVSAPWPLLQHEDAAMEDEIHFDIPGRIGCAAISEEWKGTAYELWMLKHEPTNVELVAQREAADALIQAGTGELPVVSIIVPLFNTPPLLLCEMIDSVVSQTWPKWELCLADGSTNGDAVRDIVAEYAAKDTRIRYSRLLENHGIAGNTNAAAELASGDFIGLLDHDDTLAPFALYEIVKAIRARDDVDFIYSDEDKMSEDATVRYDPHFKPDWSPDMLRSYNYITHFSVLRRTLFDVIGRYRPGYDGSQDYDLILRATEKARAIAHVPKILYHWRVFAGSTALSIEAKPYALEAAKKALRDHLVRLGYDGNVTDGMEKTMYRCRFGIPEDTFLSILIPNRDEAGTLEKCVRSILAKTAWKKYEIIIMENGSQAPETFRVYDALRKDSHVRIEKWGKPFNYSAINNEASRLAKGNVLLFLNNDTEVEKPEWLESMLEQAMHPETGAVGAKLRYRDGTLQHCGIVLGFNGIAEHIGRGLPRIHMGYMGRLKVVQNLSAITGACLMVRKNVFTEVGGFDESFPLAFNDVDLCLRIRQKGYWNVWTPFAELIHDESKTRGQEDTPEKKARFLAEKDRFHARWGTPAQLADPFYNPNFVLEGEPYGIDA